MSDRLIPVNEAEVIIAQFWDSCFMDLEKWELEDTVSFPVGAEPSSHYDKLPVIWGDGYRIRRLWDGFHFTVLRGKKLCMQKSFQIGLAHYNCLVVEGSFPEGTQVRLVALTDEGGYEQSYDFAEGAPSKEELILPIQGKTLRGVRIELHAAADIEGRLDWIMLRDTVFLQSLLDRKIPLSPKWEGYLKDETYVPEYKLKYELFARNEMVEMLREKIKDEDLMLLRAKAEALPEPEQYVAKYLNDNKRFTMKRDAGSPLLGNCQMIALAGLLCRDRKLAEKALRYSLTIACCENWVEAFRCDARGLLFEHKAFATSVSCSDISITMELAGEFLTEKGVQFLLRRLAEEGLGRINMTVWKYSGEGENIFKMNQLAWFSNGRLPAYCILEKYMPAVVPYAKLAFEELLQSIDRIILPDGSYGEGIGYFISISHYCGMAVYKYAKAHGLDYSKALPQKFKNTADYVECMLSLDDSMDYIPVCDAHPQVSATRYAAVAAMMPGTHWVTLFRRAWEREGRFSHDIFTLLMEQDIEKAPPTKFRSFLQLKECGMVSSVRSLKGELLKILVAGGRARSSHQHMDKGSFVVQYAGETVFADPGIGDYSHNVGSSMWGIRWHNILQPVLPGEIISQGKVETNLVPEAEGDELSFCAKTDLSGVWRGYFEAYTRTLSSAAPEELTVCDNYRLQRGELVEFGLVTLMQVELQPEHNRITVTGKNSVTEIIFPSDCCADCQPMPEYEGKRYSRIAIQKEGREGELNIKFVFRKL